jgi:hypothetical protein
VLGRWPAPFDARIFRGDLTKGGDVVKKKDLGRVVAPMAASAMALIGLACSSISYTEDFDGQVSMASTGTWSWQEQADDGQLNLSAVNPFLPTRIESAVIRELESRGFTHVEGGADYLVAAYALQPRVSSRPSSAPLSEYDVRQPSTTTAYVGFGVGFGTAYRVGSPYGFSLGFGFWPVFTYWNLYSWFLGPRWGWGRPYFGVRSYGWDPFFGYGVYSMGGHGRTAEIGEAAARPGTLAIDVTDAVSGDVVWEGRARGALLDIPSGDELDDYVTEVVNRTLGGFPAG